MLQRTQKTAKNAVFTVSFADIHVIVDYQLTVGIGCKNNAEILLV